MTNPDPQETGRQKLPLLGAAAYLLVPGERRRKAAGHFRRAGFETLLGLRAIARIERVGTGEEYEKSRDRERIEIE